MIAEILLASHYPEECRNVKCSTNLHGCIYIDYSIKKLLHIFRSYRARAVVLLSLSLSYFILCYFGGNPWSNVNSLYVTSPCFIYFKPMSVPFRDYSSFLLRYKKSIPFGLTVIIWTLIPTFMAEVIWNLKREKPLEILRERERNPRTQMTSATKQEG